MQHFQRRRRRRRRLLPDPPLPFPSPSLRLLLRPGRLVRRLPLRHPGRAPPRRRAARRLGRQIPARTVDAAPRRRGRLGARAWADGRARGRGPGGEGRRVRDARVRRALRGEGGGPGLARSPGRRRGGPVRCRGAVRGAPLEVAARAYAARRRPRVFDWGGREPRCLLFFVVSIYGFFWWRRGFDAVCAPRGGREGVPRALEARLRRGRGGSCCC